MEGLEALEKFDLTQDVALFGAALHLTVENSQTTISTIQDYLKSKGIQVLRIEKIDPTLEDIFVSLIESEERIG
jgi:ABC-2 type transport system ATP-binding protein